MASLQLDATEVPGSRAPVTAEIDAFTACIATNGLPAKQKAVDKVRKQLAGVSALVDLWWQRVWHDGQQVAMTPMWKRWVRAIVAADVLAAPNVAYALPTTQSQACTGVGGR